MPPRILTINEILSGLNGSSVAGPWVELPGVNGIPVVSINGPSNIVVSFNSAYVVKTFINSETAEIKSFLAKSIDLPGRENL